ncbi:MAG: DUF4403 family protein [Crocinitomicaceae bacterium]|jgi:hypothetical protein|nr:DUF4403 family protein [Crocinitomicaceae bacterium]MDP4867896.1 DUF4403 family protein [Crocinitomicaceae bacterium]MDP5043199.1 DUF4403 family protein [Crocinitomicaceae bacterium]
MKYINIVSLLLLGLFSCKTITIELPIPDFKVVEEVSAPEPSFLSLETELALKPYLSEADKSLDKKFSGGEEPCEGIQYKYHFEREPLSFELKDQEVLCDIDGKFDLSLSYCPDCQNIFGEPMCIIPRVYASCGVDEPKKKVHITYSSKIGITDDFRLRAQTKLKEFQLIDPCKITVFKYDATPTIQKEVRASLVQLEKEVDKQLASAPIHSTMTEVWKSLQEPILVAPYGYFYLRPQQIGIDNLILKNEGQKAYFTTQMVAKPLFSTDAIERPKTRLPKNTPQAKASNISVFNLRTVASYDSINRFLLRDFDTQQIKITDKKYINIDKVQVLGPQGERLVLSVQFSGTKKGTLYLVVEPYIDLEQHLRIREVDYELRTKSVLLHSAKWMLNSKLKEQIETSVDLDLGPMLMESKTAIEQQINSEITKGVWLQGKIDELSVQNLLLTTGFLVVDLRLSGKLKLKIE